MAPKNIYQLGDDHTYTTRNERPGTYADLPGAATIDLGKNKPRPSRIDFEEDSDEESILSNVTNMSILTAPKDYMREERIETLQNSRISRKSKKGSAPKGNGKPHHKSSDYGGSLSDNDESDLSSTSSEEEKSESDVASSG